MTDLFLLASAGLSECRQYRYWLRRRWDNSLNELVWIMLNPSTADADEDDPTIRRCIRFSRDLGYGSLCVVNLFAYRATDPLMLKIVADPVGSANDQQIIDAVAGNFVIAAWGASAPAKRVAETRDLIRTNALSVECLGLTKDGHPKHPLYLPANARPIPF